MYEGKKVLVTGGTGMIGSHLAELLISKGAHVRITTHERQIPEEIQNDNVEFIKGDLTNREFARDAARGIDYVFHLAAYTGGLGRTSTHPASTLTPNLIMDGNVLDAARSENVERFLYASCTCVYPNIEKDLTEADAWEGNPPAAHASYSWSKRMGEMQAISYHKEYGMKVALVRPSNSYGPRDSLDPNTAHALGALIIKGLNRMDPFVIWGDGKPIREYIYARDAARGMLLALEKYCEAEPLNLASGEYLSIEELARKIIKLCDYNPKIVFDNSKPSGQARRVLLNTKAEDKIGFKPETSMEEGLSKTLKWYQEKHHLVNSVEI